ncbi:tripartite motif-containing protein 16-like [Syngnathoides biaculeatus]|uniref:tripartite motif-containing protein 16-like n=1 Tax=Syngnathoides biaculeatus TaxID=300417 RepID=UPI002ADDFD8F|nr:tripartite motif-containing protein 16-like [Syngnathoides biaculeatus]
MNNPLSEKTPAYEPDVPEPKCRADLVKHWMKLSFDARTANKALWVTEGGAKVARITDDVTCPVLERPESQSQASALNLILLSTPFQKVLCKEGILGFRAYYEVQCSGWVVVGLASERAGRRNKDGSCGLGDNEDSWCVGWSGSCYLAWHDGRISEIRDVPRSSVLGVYIDHPAGILNFYAVEVCDDGTVGETATLLQQVKSRFYDKMLPGVWLGTHSDCVIRRCD